MRRCRRVAALRPVLASVLLLSPAATTAQTVDDVLNDPFLAQLHWGILVRDAGSGSVLYERNAARKFIPASNMKILVSAAALARLGPDHRFVTSAWAAGDLDEASGVLDGDLVVPGSGDPTLSDRYWPGDEAPLVALADSLLAVGVLRVSGALVVDASAWDSTTVAGTWMNANLPWSYSATGGAFAVAEGETFVTVRAGDAPGEPAAVDWGPRGEPGFVVGRVVTVGPGDSTSLDLTYLPESRRLRLTGTIAVGARDSLTVATRDPVRQATALMHRVFQARGLDVVGGWRVAWNEGELLGRGCRSGALQRCAAARELARLESPPLSEIVQGILEPSQNWMTEQVVRSLGRSDSTLASWPAGLDAVERFLVEEVGVDSLDVSLRDGSGLSAYNLVTPRAMVAVLEYAHRQPWAGSFRRALAEPGETDSTLERRLEALEGRLFAKTGTISNVNSLSGYLVTVDGRELVFSILTNGSGLPSSRVRAGMDRLVRIFADGF